MSKYNDFMSHIRVDDEMHRRIMNAVSEAIEQGSETKAEDYLSTQFKTSYAGAEISPLNSEEEDRVKTPIKRKAKVSVIRIISIAAAAVLVVGGAVMLATRTKGSAKSAFAVNEAAQATKAAEVDGELNVNGRTYAITGNKKNSTAVAGNWNKKSNADDANDGSDKKAEEGTQAETVEGIEQDGVKSLAPSMAPTEAAAEGPNKGDIKDSLPFKVRTVGSGSLKGNITTTVYTGVNGEKMILFKANAGTDIVKAYYPDFKGKPALLQTEAGQVFNAVDTSVGKNVQVNNAGPFDAVTWTKDGTTYMLMFSTKQDVQIFISLMELI